MTSANFDGIIQYIAEECRDLKNKYVDEDLKIDYICIFSQSQEEYKELIQCASPLGEIVDNTETGPVFKFNNPPKTVLGTPKVLKIRIPDKTRSERGGVDLTTNYSDFKIKYFDNKRFKLIEREKFEMLELRDEEFNVLVYFSSISPSELLEEE